MTWMRDGVVDIRQSAIFECEAHSGCGRDLVSENPLRKAEELGTARIASRKGDEVVVHTSTTGGNTILVLTDPFFPGWFAHIDGQETPVIRTNSLFRGVVVPPGEHRVTFSYAPMSVAAGLVTTVAMSGLLLALFGAPVLEGARRRAWSTKPWTRVPSFTPGLGPWTAKRPGSVPADVAGVSGEPT
jgi:hypothetical protein